jgi:hypothetical protein
VPAALLVQLVQEGCQAAVQGGQQAADVTRGAAAQRARGHAQHTKLLLLLLLLTRVLLVRLLWLLLGCCCC